MLHSKSNPTSVSSIRAYAWYNVAMRFSGIHTPIITPYHEDCSVDYDALETVLENLVASKVDGIISGGSTGEYYAQSIDERKELAGFIKKKIAGRLPLTVGTGAMRLDDSLSMARHAREIGADAILVSSPPYSVPTERENALNALAIDRAADLPIILYNYPGRMSVSMGEAFLDRVGRSRNFQAIKESSGDINRVHLLARDYPHIQMCCGMDDQALEFFAWGATGWVAGGANFLPREHAALYKACILESDFVKGRKIMSALLPLMRLLEQGGKFIQNIKFGCEIMGMRAGPPRPPLRALNKDDKRALERVVRVLRSTISRIESGEKQ